MSITPTPPESRRIQTERMATGPSIMAYSFWACSEVARSQETATGDVDLVPAEGLKPRVRKSVLDIRAAIT